MRAVLILGAVVVLAVVATLMFGRTGPHPDSRLVVLHRGNTAEPGTLDPPQFGLVAEVEIMDDLFEGLTTLDAHGQPVPGAAQSWDVTSGGRVYTFHLRHGLKWSDGTALTAADFVAGIRRTLDPATHAEFANFAYKIENGEKVNRGQLPSAALGVSAPDDTTLVIQLERPSPILLLLASWPLLDAFPRHAFARFGKDWVKPGNMVSNGPYTLAEWLPLDHIKLVKNPYFHDAKTVRIDEVDFYPTDDESAALKRFRAGDLDLDLRFPPNMFDWLKRNLSGEVLTAPALTISYVTFNLRVPALADLRVRRALSLAIDRETLTRDITRNGEAPAYGLVPPSVKGYAGGRIEGYGMPTAARVALAKTLLAQAGYGPGHPLTLSYAYRISELGKRIAIALQSNWRAIGVEVALVGDEGVAHYARLRQHDFELGDAGWQGRPDPEYFIYLCKSDSTETNYAQWVDPDYDRIAHDAEAIMDKPARYATFARAEQRALTGLPLTPLYFSVNRALVKPYVRDFYENAVDFHPTRWMWIDKHMQIAGGG